MIDDGRIRTVFSEPQRAATPGQSIVFYRDDIVTEEDLLKGEYNMSSIKKGTHR